MPTTQTRDHLKVSTRVLYDKFVKQLVPVTIVNAASSILEYADARGKMHLLISTCSDKSSAAGKAIADSKIKTTHVATSIKMPMPASIACRDIREARDFFDTYQHVVTKPTLGSGGSGVSVNINTKDELNRAYTYAKSYGHSVIVQQHITGEDVRLLVIGGVFCSAVIRKPAHIIGDGINTIDTLITEANHSASRNDDSQSSLMHISLPAARRFLGETIHDTPSIDQNVRVVGPANVSLGGSLHEATHLVTASMIKDAESITKKLNLGICGVDMMWDRKTNKHYLIEVNATPGIDIHDDPFSGTSSNAAELYVKWLVK